MAATNVTAVGPGDRSARCQWLASGGFRQGGPEVSATGADPGPAKVGLCIAAASKGVYYT
jgi:hypothetical protein